MSYNTSITDHIKEKVSEASVFLESSHPEIAEVLRIAANEIERLVTNRTRESEMLSEANDVLRSAHSIAARAGDDTNWPVWKKRLEKILIEQSEMIYRTSHLPAATCTPKVFKIPTWEKP